MAYFSTDPGGLGEFGCGADCSCKSCRSAANVGEVYEKEEIATPAAQPNSASRPRTVFGAPYGAWRARSGTRPRPQDIRFIKVPASLGEAPAPSAIERFGQPGVLLSPSAPIFTTDCPVPPGCPPIAVGRCGAVLRQAILEAIRLANNAASKLEVASKLEPGKRDKDAKRTAHLFRFFFGHDPSLPVPWAGNLTSGASVADRFRAVARELGGGRRVTFRCNFGARCAGRVAVTNQDLEPNVINLCARFWAPPALPGLPPEGFRAGTIIHEMLHVLYSDFFHHAGHPSGDPERRRDNAHCYKAFALRVGDYGGDPNAATRCRGRSA
jgi:Lysine-specific metallo-endopeptidase